MPKLALPSDDTHTHDNMVVGILPHDYFSTLIELLALKSGDSTSVFCGFLLLDVILHKNRNNRVKYGKIIFDIPAFTLSSDLVLIHSSFSWQSVHRLDRSLVR